MKKSVSILLACMLLISMFSFAGCGDKKNEEETAPPVENQTPDVEQEDTAEKIANSKPNEYVQEKLDAGMKPLVTFVTPRLTSDFVVAIDAGLKQGFEELGYSYNTANADNDTSQIINLIENAVEMSSAAVIVLDIPDGLGDVCANAEEKGSHIVCFGTEPDFEVAGKVVLDQGEQGKQGALMLHAWLDVAYPDAADGEVHAFITIDNSTVKNKARSDAYKEYIVKDPRITLSYVGEHSNLSMDEGYTLAQNAFTVDPEIRVGLIFNAGAAIGANNYIVANVPEDQLDQYGIFCNTQDATLIGMITGKSGETNCIRGTIGQGANGGAWYSAFECATALLTGGEEYGYEFYERIYSINNFGYEYDSEQQ